MYMHLCLVAMCVPLSAEVKSASDSYGSGVTGSFKHMIWIREIHVGPLD